MKQPEPPGLGQEREQPPDIDPLLTVLGLLHPVSPGIALYLRDHITTLSVRKRKLLLREEGICQHVYFIRKGAIRGFTREGHKEITTWINVENQLVSSIFGLNNKAPSTENIQALENCELLIMTYDDLEKLYEQIPESNVLARKLLQVYYQDAERRAFIARLTKAENKYRHYLVHHQHLANRIPLKYIASYLGMTLETLSRVRKKFSSKP
jgi:CRP-like cAMP-binding protein